MSAATTVTTTSSSSCSSAAAEACSSSSSPPPPRGILLNPEHHPLPRSPPGSPKRRNSAAHQTPPPTLPALGEGEGEGGGDGSTTSPPVDGDRVPRRPRVLWDESNLQENASQRTATMKIDEPKTPFVHYSSEDDEPRSPPAADTDTEKASWTQALSAVQFDHLEAALAEGGPVLKSEVRSKWDDVSGGSDSEEEVRREPGEEDLPAEEVMRRRKAEFKKRRAAHYNEFQTFKMMQQQGALGVDED